MYKNGFPKHLLYASCAIALAPTGTGLHATAQTPSPGPSFEVAAIKPIDPSYRFDGTHHWVHVNPAGVSYWYMSPLSLVEHAYNIEPFQVTGPDWANHDHFDIEAKFPEGAGRKDEPRMLQALLKDRFKLAFHIEKRELEGYALVVGKHGQKLTPSLPDPATPETASPSPTGESNAGTPSSKITKNPDGSSTVDMGKQGTQTLKFDHEKNAMHFARSKMTMDELAGILGVCLGSGMQKVVDETGIKGTYQVAWDCPQPTPRLTTSGSDAAALPSDPQDGSVLKQSLDALGLQLEKRKTLQDVYVIDHVERPSEN